MEALKTTFPGPEAPEKMSILAIDDETSIRKLLNFTLKEEFQVIEKRNGMEAMIWLEDGNVPDLIVTDIEMPEMNGYTLVEILRNSGFYKEIPIIMLSAREKSEERIKCLELGADDYMIKPFNPHELKLRIARLMEHIKRYKYHA
ncbi:response regulator [Persicobacter diffluens]|uniref:Two-component system response regulator n=1 Tax=Persicobacter diffluens TaxID=981 RepID=A0AAN4VYA0_9BACT|nr:two-component system response regulator [Persicobacter diffluens]